MIKRVVTPCCLNTFVDSNKAGTYLFNNWRVYELNRTKTTTDIINGFLVTLKILFHLLSFSV